MKTTPKKLSHYAAHAGETETWIDAAAPTVSEAERLHAAMSAAPELLAALEATRDALLAISKGAKSIPFGLLVDADAAIAKAKAIAKAQEPQWRMLRELETVEDGDECQHDDETWHPAARYVGRLVFPSGVGFYRRRVR